MSSSNVVVAVAAAYLAVSVLHIPALVLLLETINAIAYSVSK
jgi:hypothetical protein